MGAADKNVSAEWLLQYLDDHGSFVNAACNSGLLLHSKKMDAEAACTMWEEAKIRLQSQRFILRHLSNFFGQRLTVPESKVHELEQGSLQPISKCVEVDGDSITFWYKEIDKAIIHQIKTEMDFRGKEFFIKKWI